MSRLTLLITSVGSFLGHNILEALESVRSRIRVIGVNYDADNPRLFRCDRAYLVPKFEETEALDRRLEEIISLENPDILLPGRDHDVVALAQLRERRPDLSSKIPCGSFWLADMMQDKLATSQFARDRGLPFAETISVVAPANQIADLVSRYGFPLIAKPRRGYGSLGVRVLFDAAQLTAALRLPDYVVQPFLAPPENLADMIPDLSAGVPLFFMVPDERQFASQTVIAPGGAIVEPCYTINRMVLGRPERCELWHDPRFAEATHAWTSALSAAGWRGSLNLQFRRLADGSYLGFELNGRMSGSSSARCHLGFHEPRILVEQFLGPSAWPDTEPVRCEPGFVSRSLSDGFVAASEVARLRAEGVWTASS